MVKLCGGERIVFIGDSITDVAFNRRMNRKIGGKQVYCLQVAEKLKRRHSGLKFFYRGIASNRSYHVYDRLTKDCIDLKPDVIILLIGVNDAWENYVPEEYPPLLRPFEPHMKEIFRRISTELPNAKLIVLLPFMIDTIEEKLPFHTKLNEFRDALSELARGNADEIVDLQAMFDKAQKDVAPYDLAHDSIHPTNLGHSYIARSVLSVLG